MAGLTSSQILPGSLGKSLESPIYFGTQEVIAIGTARCWEITIEGNFDSYIAIHIRQYKPFKVNLDSGSPKLQTVQ